MASVIVIGVIMACVIVIEFSYYKEKLVCKKETSKKEKEKKAPSAGWLGWLAGMASWDG